MLSVLRLVGRIYRVYNLQKDTAAASNQADISIKLNIRSTKEGHRLMKTGFTTDSGAKYRCRLEKSEKYIEESGRICVYGVSLFREGAEYSSDEYENSRITDITSKKSTAEEFIALIVRNKLLPVHLADAAYDFIG